MTSAKIGSLDEVVDDESTRASRRFKVGEVLGSSVVIVFKWYNF